MELTGKIIEVLDKQTGNKKDGGTWQKQQYVLETQGLYPKKICFMVWGDHVDTFNLKIDEVIRIEIDIESREFNGRWYTDVKAWKYRKLDDVPPIESKGGVAEMSTEDTISEDDMPF